MHVTDSREEMMLDLEIQPAKKPAQDAASPSKIDGRLHLMDCPVGLHALAALSVCHRHGKFSFFNAMRNLCRGAGVSSSNRLQRRRALRWHRSIRSGATSEIGARRRAVFSDIC